MLTLGSIIYAAKVAIGLAICPTRGGFSSKRFR